MLSRDLIADGVRKLYIHLDLDKTEEELTLYTNELHEFMDLKNVTEKQFEFAIYKYLENNTSNSFNKFPPVGAFLKILGLTDDFIEDVAKLQLYVVKSAEYNKRLVLFDDLATNFVIKNHFNGLREMDINSQYFNNEFTKAYISARRLSFTYDKPLEYFKPILNPEGISRGEPPVFDNDDTILVIGSARGLNLEKYIEQPYRVGKQQLLGFNNKKLLG